MSCSIIEGYFLSCRDNVGGIKTIWITEFQNVSSYTESSGTISAITQAASTKFWKYDLEKENGALEEEDIPSVENGTRFWQPTLTFTMKKLSAKNRNNIKLVGQNRIAAIVLLNSGEYKAIGFVNGLDMTSAKGTSGKAFGDLAGYAVTFTGKETVPIMDVNSSVITSMTQGQ
jgi:hypothetical protein